MRSLFLLLKKILELKLNVLVVLFAGSVLLYSASKGSDGLWKFSSGNSISSSQMNENFETVKIPTGAIIPFYLTSCPSGWTIADGNNGTPDLRGIFIRGKDLGKGIDPNGDRTLGNFQEDTFQGHYHDLVGDNGQKNDILAFQESDLTNSYGVLDSGVKGDSYIYVGSPKIGLPAWGEPRISSETRPKNIALLYCMKK